MLLLESFPVALPIMLSALLTISLTYTLHEIDTVI